MSGHSKWANIKHKKGAADQRRGEAFTKAARAITIAAREGGGDLDSNFALRLAVEKARLANMPKDRIERAIARGTGDAKGEQLERIVYEGYGPNGTAILVETVTDNRTRTVGDVRHLFSRYGGNLGETGSVGWQFVQLGVISVAPAGSDPDDLALAAIDAGASDVDVESDVVTVYTSVAELRQVREALVAGGYEVGESELAMVPSAPVDLGEKETLSVLRFVEALEELDDVDRVWTNIQISDAVAEQFALS